MDAHHTCNVTGTRQHNSWRPWLQRQVTTTTDTASQRHVTSLQGSISGSLRTHMYLTPTSVGAYIICAPLMRGTHAGGTSLAAASPNATTSSSCSNTTALRVANTAMMTRRIAYTNAGSREG